MDKQNALSDAPVSIDEKYEAARRRNNYLREIPVEKPRSKGWKIKPGVMGGLKPHGIKVTGKLEF